MAAKCLRFLVLLLTSVVCFEASGDYGVVAPFRYEDAVFHYAGKVYDVEKNRRHKTPLTLTGLEFTLVAWEPVTTPYPVFELLPFADQICVQVTNIGWGPYDGPAFRLHSFERLETLDLASEKPVGIVRHSIDLPVIKTSAVFPFRHDGVAFGFHKSGLFRPGDLNPRALVPAWAFPQPRLAGAAREVLELGVETIRPKEDMRAVTKPPEITADVKGGTKAGRAVFHGELRVGSSTLRTPYYAKHLQPAHLSDDEMNIARVFADPSMPVRSQSLMAGGLMTDWEVAFGNWDVRFAKSIQYGVTSGITVDFGDPEKQGGTACETVHFPEVPLAEAPKFLLQFRTDRSGEFRVKVRPMLAYKGESLDVPTPLSDELVNAQVLEEDNGDPFAVYVPRPHDRGWRETKRFVQRTLSKGPTTRDVLSTAMLPMESGSLTFDGTLAHRKWQARLWCDALLAEFLKDEHSNRTMVMLSQTASYLEQLANKIATDRTFNQRLRRTKYSYAEFEILERCLPLLCVKIPSSGATVALSFFELGDVAAMECGMTIAGSRSQLIENLGHPVRKVVLERLSDSDFSPVETYPFNVRPSAIDAVCAAHVGGVEWAAFRDSNLFAISPWTLGYCLGITQAPALRKIAEEWLESYGGEQSPPKIVGLIAGLSLTPDVRSIPFVERIAGIAYKRFDTAILVQCLDFLRSRHSSSLDRHLIEALKEYPSDSSVRELAKEALKRR